jgi:hypothetical protein
VELARSELTRSARYFERRLGEKDFAALAEGDDARIRTERNTQKTRTPTWGMGGRRGGIQQLIRQSE